MNARKKKDRQSNFELLRIFAIFAIIVSHFNIHSNFAVTNPLEFNLNYLLSIVGQVGVISNIIFMVISGYFLVNSNPKPKKIISLIIEMYFYSVLIFLGIKFFTNHNITTAELKETFLPFPYGNWYCAMYVIIYLVSPYLNKLAHSLTKDELKKLVITLFAVFSILPFFSMWNVLSRLSIFFLGYFIGAYIKLHAREGLDKNKIKKYLLVALAVTYTFVILLYLASVKFDMPVLKSSATVILVANCSPFVITIATLIFLYFRELNIKQNKIINSTAASVLGIYLIHENIFLRPIIWQKVATININSIGPIQFICFCILKCACVFIICLAIDKMRGALFSLIGKQKR